MVEAAFQVELQAFLSRRASVEAKTAGANRTPAKGQTAVGQLEVLRCGCSLVEADLSWIPAESLV